MKRLAIVAAVLALAACDQTKRISDEQLSTAIDNAKRYKGTVHSCSVTPSTSTHTICDVTARGVRQNLSCSYTAYPADCSGVRD